MPVQNATCNGRGLPCCLLSMGTVTCGSTSMLKTGVSDYAVRQHEPGSLLPLTAATAARYWQRKN